MKLREIKEEYKKYLEGEINKYEKYEMIIDISDYNYIQISVKDENGQKEIIKLNDNENKTKLSIEFEKEEIIIA